MFYIPSVSAGRYIPPTEVHALDASAFQVGWTADSIHLTDKKGNLFAIGATKPAIDRFNDTLGRQLGVTVRAFPAGTAPARPNFFDALLQPQTCAPVSVEIAAGEPSIPGAALDETTDPAAFETWRPVSHLEVIGDVLGIVGALAPVARIPEVGAAAIEVAGETEPLAAQVARNTPGVVTASRKLSPASGVWLRAGVPTPIPSQAGDVLVGQRFNTFSELRASFWKNVAGDPELSAHFEQSNLENMEAGYAPFAPSDFQTNVSDAGMRFNLHHVTAIEDGGPVYDLGNIRIADPATHYAIHYRTLKRRMEEEMVKRLNRDQLISAINIVCHPKDKGVSSEEVNRLLLLFCANCPDPVGAMDLVVGNMTPMTNEQIVDRALAMPVRDVRDVPLTQLRASHPLRYMRVDG